MHFDGALPDGRGGREIVGLFAGRGAAVGFGLAAAPEDGFARACAVGGADYDGYFKLTIGQAGVDAERPVVPQVHFRASDRQRRIGRCAAVENQLCIDVER